MNGNNVSDSIGSTRRRLWLLLLRAFSVVILLILLIIVTSTVFYLGSSGTLNPYYQAPVAYLLETYYLGHGSWQGVEGIFNEQTGLPLPATRKQWLNTVLLDAQGRVVVDHGQTDTERIGQVYVSPPGVNRYSLSNSGQAVGALVFERGWFVSPSRAALELLAPIIMISILLGLLTLLIGLLLMRRVVNPLAEVISAARAVASGDLGARVPLHRRHDDLYALSASFNQMAESLERQDQQRRMMLEDIAHELRTPLSIVRGRLEGVVDGIYPAEAASIAPALEEAYLMERLVDDLRLLTLAEARQIPLEVRPFDLQELAEKVVATFSAEAEELGIALSADTAAVSDDTNPPPSAIAVADPQRVEQVIGNLIGNSLRYTPSGGQINVSVRRVGAVVALQVADSGVGITEEELPHIFERFWRGEKSRSRASGGAGLGLSISRQLVEAMGGEISARNLPEGGLAVSFSLPAG